MFSSSDLVQFRDAFLKLSKASVRVKDQELKVDLGSTEDTNAPFGIVVPEHLVPVVERLWRKEF